MKFGPKKMRVDFDIQKYHNILCPDAPSFLQKYLTLPILTRLKGVGLLCGTDWTPLFHNAFYYSRFDHSVGTALIVWNWTHNKAQTLAALLHDVSTPAFSHVGDFRNGDALTQTSTEGNNAHMIQSDTALLGFLSQDKINVNDIDDYHCYPICDNEIPFLSADRLEYMFPSGAALDGIFDLKSISRLYNDIIVLKNEHGNDELGFETLACAKEYFCKTMKIGMILQKNEDKVAMQLMAEIIQLALDCNFLKEGELFLMSETEIMTRWDAFEKGFSGMIARANCGNAMPTHKISATSNTARGDGITETASKPSATSNTARVGSDTEKMRQFLYCFDAYRSMKKIVRSSAPIEKHFNVCLDVKKRYINPLVQTLQGARRITQVSKVCAIKEKHFLHYKDAPYGCVKLY